MLLFAFGTTIYLLFEVGLFETLVALSCFGALLTSASDTLNATRQTFSPKFRSPIKLRLAVVAMWTLLFVPFPLLTHLIPPIDLLIEYPLPGLYPTLYLNAPVLYLLGKTLKDKARLAYANATQDSPKQSTPLEPDHTETHSQNRT